MLLLLLLLLLLLSLLPLLLLLLLMLLLLLLLLLLALWLFHPVPARHHPSRSVFFVRRFPKEPSAAAERQVVEQFLHHLAATCCRAGHW